MKTNTKARRVAAGGEERGGERGAATRSDDANAFMPDPLEGPAQIDDDIAESLAEEFVTAATSGQDPTEDQLDELTEEEFGGPFIVTSAGDELAGTVDSMNPEDATREPLPRVMSAMVQPSLEELPDVDEEDLDEEDAIDVIAAETTAPSR